MNHIISWPSKTYWKENYKVFSEQETFNVSCISSIHSPCSHSLLFVKELTPEIVHKLSSIKDSIIVTTPAYKTEVNHLLETNGFIFDENPRYKFAEILEPFWKVSSLRGTLIWNEKYQAYLGSNVSINPGVHIEPYVTIGDNSTIGENVYLMSGVKIGPNVRIGNNSIIRENSVVGGWGFGFALEDRKSVIRLPHIGGVLIGESVEVGALTTICSGTIDPTIIEDNVLIDDNVIIAHNCRIGKSSIITGGVAIAGSVVIEENCWIAPHVAIIQKVVIGKNSTLGIGSIVMNSIKANSVVLGNPARLIEKK